jgi:hypothetical protein
MTTLFQIACAAIALAGVKQIARLLRCGYRSGWDQYLQPIE